MTRQEVYEDMKETLGLVPTFFKSLPDASIELEWKLFKKVQMEEGAVPNKFRELVGLGIAAATRCRYCTLYHTEIAKVCGATDAEIEDAIHFGKSSMGWSEYINGLQLDYDQFKREVQEAARFVKSKMEHEMAGAAR